MKVLITGVRGFVGRHMLTYFPTTGKTKHEVVGLDIKNGPAEDVRDWFRKDKTQFDLVIHLAAVVGGREQIEGAPLSLAVDLSIDAEMFSWAVRTRPTKVVYFSSSAAYPICLQESSGTLSERMIRLDTIREPDLVYGWAKLTGEMLAQHARDQGISVLVVRPFSGYGEDQDETYPFRAYIERAKKRANPFEIWGDGTQVRDFIHIDDVCQATLAAVEMNLDGPVNLGTGRATSFNELAQKVCLAAGYWPTVKHLGDKPVGVQYRVADTKLMSEFYTPKISLEEGVIRALSKR